MTRPRWAVAAPLVLAVALLLTAGCGGPTDPFNPGADVTHSADQLYATLRQRPDIDQATQRYEQMSGEIRHALTHAIPELAPWEKDGELSGSGCSGEYTSIGFDGETRDLPDYIVLGNLPDNLYNNALTVVGAVARKYGFTPQPQQLHDRPGNHFTVLHNLHDDGAITFGTAKNTLLGITTGCYLTAAAKKRGRPSPTPTY